MHVCLISVEIFAWGKYGGFGRATRLIGGELVKRGVQVTAIVPRREEQKPVEELDGIRVLSFRFPDFRTASRLFRETTADVFHSQEPSTGTYLAMRENPDKKHIMTFRDPRTPKDWGIELKLPSLNYLQVLANWIYEDNWLVDNTVRNADGWFTIGRYLIPKVKEKYDLQEDPVFLPTPVGVPATVQKSDKPTVCYMNRWDRRKRPELFFELAKKFPNVNFLAVGKSRDQKYEKELRERYGSLPNLNLVGFIDQFNSARHSKILQDSWVFVNTAAREALPNSFIEAAAHGCAILSSVDPDGIASNFGYYAEDDNFEEGLAALLENNRWKQKGLGGRTYIQDTFELNKAIDRHLTIYENLTGVKRPDLV